MIGAGSIRSFAFLEKTIHFVFDLTGFGFVPNFKFLLEANSWQILTRLCSPGLLAESNKMSSEKISAPRKTESKWQP